MFQCYWCSFCRYYLGYQISSYSLWISTTNGSTTAPVTLPIISESACMANNTNDLLGNPGNIRVGATDSGSNPDNFVAGENVIHTFCVCYSNLTDLEAGIISVGERVITVGSNIGVTKDGLPITALSVSVISGSLTLSSGQIYVGIIKKVLSKNDFSRKEFLNEILPYKKSKLPK